MFLEDSFYRLIIEGTLIPQSISLLLYFRCIESSQHIFHFRNSLIASTVIEHLQKMQLYWIDCSCFHTLFFRCGAPAPFFFFFSL